MAGAKAARPAGDADADLQAEYDRIAAMTPEQYAQLVADNEAAARPERIRNVRASIVEWRARAAERRERRDEATTDEAKAAYEAKAKQYEADIARAQAWLTEHA